MEVSAPNLCRAAIEMLSIPAQSAASERIFSVMNCVVTKSRCSLKQKNVGPLVQSAMRYKQQRVRKRLVMSNTEDFPPLGLLRLDETQDLIDDNMSDVTYQSLASDLDDDVDEVQAHPNTAEAEAEDDYDGIMEMVMVVVTTVKLVNFKTLTSKSFKLRLKNQCMMNTEILSLSLEFNNTSSQGIKSFKVRIGKNVGKKSFKF